MHYITMNSTIDVAKRELIRGPQLEVLVPRRRGLPFDEGLRVAEQGRRVIASNLRLHRALTTKEWKAISEVFACHAGTMVGFVEPGERLGEVIIGIDSVTGVEWPFLVPKEFRGMKDCAIVVEHPYYNIEPKGNERIVRAESGKVEVVEDLPPKTGYYLIDPDHGIPQGKAVEPKDGVDWAYLARVPKRVGPAWRGGYDGGLGDYVGRGVGLGDGPSSGFGVAVEAPEGGAEKSAAPAEVQPHPKLIREAGRLIVEGTPEQLDALERQLRQ